MYANRGGITKESVQINHFLFLHDEKQSSREIFSKKKRDNAKGSKYIHVQASLRTSEGCGGSGGSGARISGTALTTYDTPSSEIYEGGRV
jgi:hypothetical protein